MASRLLTLSTVAPVAARDEIIAFLDDLLDASAFEDYGPNGLQVAGAEEVSLVVTGVSAHLELFERAAAAGAQLVLCHHGLLWRKQPLPIDSHRRARLKALFDADMSLAAYHLPLDAHPDVGNNALICEALRLERSEPFGVFDGQAIGWTGRAAEPVSRVELVSRCARAFEREPLAFEYGPDSVGSVGIVSGGGAGGVQEAIERGLDAVGTGEPSEPALAEAREAGVTLGARGDVPARNVVWP